MLKTERVLLPKRNEQGAVVMQEVEQPLLDRRSNEPIVTEDRAPGPFRALPRKHRDRAVSYEQSKAWLPIYQRYEQGLMVGLACWKCGRSIVGWAPALRRPASWKPGDPDELIHVNGSPAVKLTCHNHYREGVFRYRRPDGVFSEFSYLHCADCTITDADGDDLLTCFLTGHDHTRTTLGLYDDDVWAQWMWRWSAVELVGRQGASKGPGDLIQEALKKGSR